MTTNYVRPASRMLFRSWRWLFSFFFLLLFLLTSQSSSSAAGYPLSPEQQRITLAWAAVSDRVARETDIPSVTPLVLWYKESSLSKINPANGEGIAGLHDLVASGRMWFRPGPVTDAEIASQLRIAAGEYKKRCPAIHYDTADAQTIKRCYLAYNAGPNATLNPDRSAYVMNNADAAHMNMVHRNGRQMQNYGAWPVHLAIEGLLGNSGYSPIITQASDPYTAKSLGKLEQYLLEGTAAAPTLPTVETPLRIGGGQLSQSSQHANDAIAGTPQPIGKITQSRLYIDENRALVLSFCGINLHQKVEAHVWDRYSRLNVRIPIQVDFGNAEQCITVSSFGQVNPTSSELTFYSMVSTIPGLSGAVCARDVAVCSSLDGGH